jgi:putative colanic acid biosynthesis acetyltransferase WcaF
MIEKQKFDIDSCRATKNYSNGEIVYRLIWAVANPLLFRLSPRLLYRWRSFLLRCFGAKIGAAVRIHQTVHIRYPWLLKIDSNTSIGQNATVYNLGPIKIGSRSTVSQGVHLCAGTHDHRQVDFPLIRAAINIGDDTWVCADAFVGPLVINASSELARSS